jgi:hypothetical protein
MDLSECSKLDPIRETYGGCKGPSEWAKAEALEPLRNQKTPIVCQVFSTTTRLRVDVAGERVSILTLL